MDRTADLQSALAKLTELDQLKRAFLNNVSHEMKTPLTNIRSYADLLRRYPQQREKNADEYLGIIHDETVHLETMVNDLLSYTKVKEPPRGEFCDLVAVLEDVLAQVAPAAQERHLTVPVQKPDADLFYEINREDAAVLFRQILDNAIKFSPEGVKVKVYLLQDPRKVIFAVRDYGPGFPKDQQERLMEPVEAEQPAGPQLQEPRARHGPLPREGGPHEVRRRRRHREHGARKQRAGGTAALGGDEVACSWRQPHGIPGDLLGGPKALLAVGDPVERVGRNG